MLFRQRRLAAFLVPGLLWFGGFGCALAQESGPTFIPHPYRHDQGTGAVPSYPPGYPGGYDSGPYPQPYRPEPETTLPNTQDALSTLLLTGDPVTLIPHALHLANKYGILQCLVVLTAVFMFQYVRNAQKGALHREEFFQQQLESSDRRTTEDLSRLSVKLSDLDQDLRSLQEKFDRHSELIRTNGELSREIVATMAAHNRAVEKGIGELSVKLDHLAARRNGTRMKPS
jgi:hypothetical protein